MQLILLVADVSGQPIDLASKRQATLVTLEDTGISKVICILRALTMVNR